MLNFLVYLLVSAASGVFFVRVVRHFLAPRQGKLVAVITYLTLLTCSSMVIQVGDAFNILATLPFFFLCILLCYQGSAVARFSVALLLFVMTMSFNALQYSYVEQFGFGLTHFVRTIFWFAIYLLVRRIIPDSRPSLSHKLWLSIDALTVSPFAVTLICVLMGGWRNQGRMDMANLLLMFALFASVALLFLVMMFVHQDKLERAQVLWAMRSQYYDNLEHEQHQVRRLRHDMANHLQTMSGLDNGAMRAYLSELITSPAIHCGKRLCENEIVNAVLLSKMAQCEEFCIRTELVLSIPTVVPVAEVDLCALFANALDNAIEACCKLPESERSLSLKSRADRGLFMLELRNAAPDVAPNQDFKTTKPDKQNHGYGLAGIREIAARYQGSLALTQDGGMFTLLLSFPMEPSS